MIKKQIHHFLKGKVRIFTYIAPNTIIGKYTTIGEGSIIAPNCILSTNVEINQFVTINCGSQIGHDCFVDSFSSLMPSVDLVGCVRLGESVLWEQTQQLFPRGRLPIILGLALGLLCLKTFQSRAPYLGNPATLLRF